MLLAHYIDLDTTRHKYGFYSKEAFEALKRHDEKLCEIVKTLKDENLYEDSTIVLLGDHSSIDVNNVIFLNSIFYFRCFRLLFQFLSFWVQYSSFLLFY